MDQSTLCPRFEKGMQLLSKRWTVLIIYQLLSGPKRFGTIESSIPISGRLLSERLKDLESEGIVNRHIYPEIPVRIEYSLTEKGFALEPIIRDMEQWCKQWIELEEETTVR
ncbi:helix-turn-helix domain-containing protein [Paenibacillus sediminis]|uniref:DNA-binding HxlR family transcriptional regulator n=1 Tax=Paenibacillus sediminis TaxID=664909 RepID=A0ABS4H1A7_9BACL|nr:helix-turn-helix domain-containing protein [Paenibacillus sediminis]MBP1936318.1 DNA-binding HxlR family transcriptional regulator [Paenibacillus sediminis]